MADNFLESSTSNLSDNESNNTNHLNDEEIFGQPINSNSKSQDSDSGSSFFTALDPRDMLMTSNHASSENYSPNFTITTTADSCNRNELCAQNNSVSTNITSNDGVNTKIYAQPSIEIEHVSSYSSLYNRILSNLPKIVAVERKSRVQYQVDDPHFPSLSQSFLHCFNNPVLDLLIVVLNSTHSVCFYQGYFSGTPQLKQDLINLSGKKWKSFISNNDESAWDNHYKSVNEIFKNQNNADNIQFESGPVIRCRLRNPPTSGVGNNGIRNNQYYSTNNNTTNAHRHNITNYYFIQPCSFMMRLSTNNTLEDSFSNELFMVSFINIARECETEFALKGSAAASLQKVITNPMGVIQSLSKQSIVCTSVNNSNTIITTSPVTTHCLSQSANIYHPHNTNNIQHRYSNIDYSFSPVPSFTPRQAYYINNTNNITNTNPQSLQYMLESTKNTGNINTPNGAIMYPNKNLMTNQSFIRHHQQQQQQPVHYYANPYQRQPPQYHPQPPMINCDGQYYPRHNTITQTSSPPMTVSSKQQLSNNSSTINSMPHNPPTLVTVVMAPNNNSNNNNVAQLSSLTNPLHVNTHMHQNSLHQHQLSQHTSSSAPQYINNNHIQQMHYQEPDNWYNNKILNNNNNSMNNHKLPSVSLYEGENQTDTLNDNPISFDIVEEILQAEEAKSDNNNNNHNNISLLDNPFNQSIVSDSTDDILFNIDDFIPLTNDSISTAPSILNTSNSINNNNKANSSTTSDSTVISNNNVQHHISTNNDSAKHYSTHQHYNNGISIPNANNNNNSTNSNHPNHQFIKSTFTQSKQKHPLLNLKAETLQKLSSTQRQQIKQYVSHYKSGTISKSDMYKKIMYFLAKALGNNTFHEQVMEFWSSHRPLSDIDSNLSGVKYSHVVQSPEEGPGISPTEQAAQSTTDLENEDLTKSVGGSINHNYSQSQATSCRMLPYSHHNSIRTNSNTSLPPPSLLPPPPPSYQISTNSISSETNSFNNFVTSTTSSIAHNNNIGGNQNNINNSTNNSNTGVLEKLLNEHEHHTSLTAKSNDNSNNNMTKKINVLPVSFRNQVSLDKLLFDDQYTSFLNYSTFQSDDSNMSSSVKKDDPSPTLSRSLSNINNPSSIKSQPTSSAGNATVNNSSMGVLETLLNQKNSSLTILKQKSTENILLHKSSRQNSFDSSSTVGSVVATQNNNDNLNTLPCSVDSNNTDLTLYRDNNNNNNNDNGNIKKNSLLITLLNNSNSNNQLMTDQINTANYSNPKSVDNVHDQPNPKRRRISSGMPLSTSSQDKSKKIKKEDICINRNNSSSGVTNTSQVSNSRDIFDFLESDLPPQLPDYNEVCKRRQFNTNQRKRQYSLDSNHSDGSTINMVMNTSHPPMKQEEKTSVILTSLLENKPPTMTTANCSIKVPINSFHNPLSSQASSMESSQIDLTNSNLINQSDDIMNIDDIKIDDFDLDNIMELAEECLPSSMLNSNNNTITNSHCTASSLIPPDPPQYPHHFLNNVNNSDLVPVYSEIGPIIKSDPIIPSSKQSILRVSDRNRVILSAITSSSSSYYNSNISSAKISTINPSSINLLSGECLDSERERLLRQQQMQKLSMARSWGDHLNNPLSLDKFSKQMKEVGPNVTVEISNIPDTKPRSTTKRNSICKMNSVADLSAIPQPTQCNITQNNSSFANKMQVSPNSNNVNRQQIKEGLRQLVNNRSAAQNQLNTQKYQTNTTTTPPNISSTSGHHHQLNPSTSYPNQQPQTLTELIQQDYPLNNVPSTHMSSSSSISTPSTVNMCKKPNVNQNTTDLLEDSLVNDVFGLEELVNNSSNSNRGQLSTNDDDDELSLRNDKNQSHDINDHQPQTSSNYQKPSVKSEPMTIPVPHHHHHLHHHHHHPTNDSNVKPHLYHHHHHHYPPNSASHHHHHHHHPITQQPQQPPTNPTQNTNSNNSGLLETLLSR